jgi:hypothetical protein
MIAERLKNALSKGPQYIIHALWDKSLKLIVSVLLSPIAIPLYFWN